MGRGREPGTERIVLEGSDTGSPRRMEETARRTGGRKGDAAEME